MPMLGFLELLALVLLAYACALTAIGYGAWVTVAGRIQWRRGQLSMLVRNA